jgi:hypothetical protein
MRLTGFAAVKREVFAHDANRNRATRGKILRAIDRMPKRPHIPACDRAGSGMDEIKIFRSLDRLVHERFPGQPLPTSWP